MKKLYAGAFLLLFAMTVPGQIRTVPASPPTTTDSASAPDEAAEAFRNFDFAALAINPNNLTAGKIAELRRNFYPEVKPLISETGKSVRRLARVSEPVFLFHRAQKSQTIVFTHERPTIFTWKETFVIVSTGALEILSDDELAALIAHEIGHLYYAAALGRAREAGDDRTARLIELKCDLVALRTLTNLRIKPAKLISAVKKLIERRTALKIGSFEPGSASLESRAEILRLYVSMTGRSAKGPDIIRRKSESGAERKK